VGCGNGAFARYLKQSDFEVRGVDPSEEAIVRAREADPLLPLETGSAYDDLAGRFGQFPLVTSLEVVEHVYYPRKYAATIAKLLESGGTALISTPYHSYLKNLTLAASGKMDQHFTALWDHGHIKFWSVKTLTTLFAESGLVRRQVLRVGRFPALAKSMILVFEKP
jgi:2-polyprenyl-6-hydroxyphenyl methylase/3-demethylubiquinone-9 3-methyltransferase